MRLLTLEEAAELPAAVVGGKAKGLGRLGALNLPVPPARVLDVTAHARFLGGGGLDDAVMDALVAAARELGAPLAVRSSATDEDAEDKSAAGQYESVMGVGSSVDELRAAVEYCFRAAGAERARAYRGAGESHVALVVQREVSAQRAGVAFSVDPVSGAEGTVIIEAVFGHGEGIVSGELTPDRYLVSRADGSIRARRAEKAAFSDGRGTLHELPRERRLARVLRDDDARRVADVVIAAEQGLGAPVDVEFCWAGPELWLVQCRPVTTLRVAA